jgi:uncharacterized protein YecE (DUF72 family)
LIYIGTCGYAYTDWLGTFYPATIRRGEMLRFYTRCFPAVEVDASYYGLLAERTIDRMIENTPADFRFSFKVPRTLTHSQPADAQASLDADAFVSSVLPVLNAGKFACALLQFPNAFKPTDTTRAYLHKVVQMLQPLPLVAEFRNHEWQDARTHRTLRELRVGWCNVDMPQYKSLLHPSADVTSAVAYVRFHGRNAAQWWKGDNTTRYDYDYRPDELEPWTQRVAELNAEVPQTYAFFNNHARGNAPRNAEMLLDMLRERYGAAAEVAVPAQDAPPAQRSLFE